MTSASAVSAFPPPFQISRSKPMASNIPHLVGMRVDAIRQSAPACAFAPVLFWCVDMCIEDMASTSWAGTGTDLFGRDRCRDLVEVGRTLLEERRQRFLGFGGND